MKIESSVQSLVVDALAELDDLWQIIGLSEQEQLQEQQKLITSVENCCRVKVETWRNEVTIAKARVIELEKEVHRINVQLQGNDSIGWCMQSLEHLGSGTLCDRLSALEMEYKFLDRVRSSRQAGVEKLQAHLGRMDKKLGTTSELPSGMPVLSEEYKEALHDMLKCKAQEVHSRRAALLDTVSECAELAKELQIETNHTLAPDLTAQLKKRDLSSKLLEKISLRTAELREVKKKRKLRLAEMLEQIRDLWRELKISDDEQKRFHMTIHGMGEAALASCEAELTRLQRQHKRYAATVVQVANLRNAITEYWNLLGYTSDQRNYFTAMMTTPDSALSYRVFRAHEKEVERLRKQLSTKKILCQYIVKREEILQARAEYDPCAVLAYIIRICENNLLLCAHRHGVPDEQTRLRIECDLPKYTDILANRIAKWQKDTGVVFRWNGESYLEQMWTEENKTGKQAHKIKRDQPQKRLVRQAQTNLAGSGGPTDRRRHVQQSNRHSVEERTTSRNSVMKEQFQHRRSDTQVSNRPQWRKFIRNTFSRHDSS